MRFYRLFAIIFVFQLSLFGVLTCSEQSAYIYYKSNQPIQIGTNLSNTHSLAIIERENSNTAGKLHYIIRIQPNTEEESFFPVERHKKYGFSFFGSAPMEDSFKWNSLKNGDPLELTIEVGEIMTTTLNFGYLERLVPSGGYTQTTLVKIHSNFWSTSLKFEMLGATALMEFQHIDSFKSEYKIWKVRWDDKKLPISHADFITMIALTLDAMNVPLKTSSKQLQTNSQSKIIKEIAIPETQNKQDMVDNILLQLENSSVFAHSIDLKEENFDAAGYLVEGFLDIQKRDQKDVMQDALKLIDDERIPPPERAALWFLIHDKIMPESK